jgi:hypothetical protein
MPTDQRERERERESVRPLSASQKRRARAERPDEFGLTQKPISNWKLGKRQLGNGTKNGHKINDSKALLLTITSHHRLQVKVTPHDDTGSSNTRRPS